MRIISRTKLFDDAWSRPLTAIAAEFGISSAALKKICSRHHIPTPGRGYWAQVATGKIFPRPALEPAFRPSLEQVRIVGARVVPQAAADAEQAAMIKLMEQHPEAEPASELGLPVQHHRITTTLRKALVHARPDDEGFKSIDRKGLIPVKTSDGTMDRALNWLDAFLSLAAQQGAHLDQSGERAQLVVNGEPIRFRIEEKAARTPHIPTPKELAKQAKDSSWRGTQWTPWSKYDDSPSGLLSVIIEANAWSGLRKTFADGKRQSLQTLLPEIYAAFVGHAALIADHRRKAEEAERALQIRQAQQERERSFETREEQRMAFVRLVDDALLERERLERVLGHLKTSQDVDAGPEGMLGFLARRIAQINALISPTAMELSARYSNLKFEENAEGKIEQDWRYHSTAKLRLWRLDRENDQATSPSALEWSREEGLIPPL